MTTTTEKTAEMTVAVPKKEGKMQTVPSCRPIFAHGRAMGRGDRGREAGQATATRRATKAEASDKLLSRYEWFVRGWEGRMLRGLDGSEDTLVDQITAKARALNGLTYNDTDQKLLIKAVQDCARIREELAGSDDLEDQRKVERAKRIEAKARELFILCHTGFVEKHIAPYVTQFDADRGESALDRLRSAAWQGLSTAMDRYDFNRPAKPLTYARNWVRAEISHITAHEGRAVRMKSKAHDLAKKVEALCKKIENEGRQPTIAEIADKTGESQERIAEVMPFARRNMVRLDAPVSSDDSDPKSVGAMIIDESQQVEEPIVDADVRQRVHEAVAAIPSPLHRRVLELFYGLADNETVQQKDLFDGVYRDAEGNAYSAEPSVIADRKKRGETVIKRSQRELNEKFKEGELVFEPGTPEAHELARAAKGTLDLEAEFEKVITAETGIPPTSGTIQEAKRKAEEMLRQSPLLAEIAPIYRGRDELENSETARDQVRKALLAMGVVDRKSLDRLMSSRSASGGKSALRRLAEKHGLVDPESGKRVTAKIAELLND